MDRGLKVLGAIAAVIGLITGVGTIVGFVQKHSLTTSLQNAIPAVGWVSPDRVTYTTLGDLVTATEKARRDAPAIAVCEI